MLRYGIGVVALTGLLCALVAGEPAVKSFALVYSVNNSGYYDVCGCKHKEVKQGSLTRRASVLKQIQATGRKLLLVDGGSTLFPIEDRVKDEDLPEALRKAELIVEAFNRMGYQAMAVGSFDLAAGLDNLKALEKRAKFPFLSANLVDKTTLQPYFKPHVIVEVTGLRIGLIGLTLNTMSKNYLSRVAPDAATTDPIEAAKKCMEELRGKVDLVIALSHIRDETNIELIQRLPELEIVLDPFIQFGNHHTWIQDDEWATLKGETLLLRGDGQGARLGLVDIQFAAPRAKLLPEEKLAELLAAVSAGKATDQQKAELEKYRGKNLYRFLKVSLEPHYGTDPEIDEMISIWQKKGDPATVARPRDRLPRKGDYLTVEKCKPCHEKQHEFWRGTKHAEAYTTLIEKGSEGRFDCIGCHSLGYGQAFLDLDDIGPYANVQCESCHGTKPKHAETPKEAPFGKIQRADSIVCHNKEVTGNDFDFFRLKPKVQCPKG